MDRRADIWAFGCVLFEMLTGKRAFEGEDVSVTLAEIIKSEPNLAVLPAGTPGGVRQALRLCFSKDPRRRGGDIAAIRLALEGAFESDPVAAGEASASRPLAGARLLPWAAGVLLAIATGLAVWVATRPSPAAVERFDVTPAAPLRDTGVSTSEAISPDGRTIAFLTGGTVGSNGGQLMVRSLDQLDARVLVESDTAGLAHPFFSADGAQVGYWDNVATPRVLMRVSLSGGAPSVVTTLQGQVRGADWGPDGFIVFSQEPTSGLWRVRASGGDPEMLTEPDPDQGEVWHRWPDILPDGKHVLFTLYANGAANIAVLSLETREYHLLVPGGDTPRYVPTGYLQYDQDGTLWAVGFDPDRLEVTGEPVPVVEGVAAAEGYATEYSVSDTGSLLYATGTAGNGESQLVWVDRQGREEPLGAPPRSYAYATLSPDGRRIAVDLRDEERDIWVWDFERLQRLTFDSGLNRSPVWFPDGRRLAFSRQLDGQLDEVYWQNADGSGAPIAVTADSPRGALPSEVSPDGATLLYAPDSGGNIWMVPVAGPPTAARLLLAGGATERNPDVSPDGQWLAYESNESGQYEIYLRPFPDVEAGRQLVSVNGGTRPHWRADGRELFYFLDGAIWAVPVRLGTDAQVGAPVELFKGDYITTNLGRNTFDVTNDGERFLMIKAGDQRDPLRLVLVQNWFTELERLVPTD